MRLIQRAWLARMSVITLNVVCLTACAGLLPQYSDNRVQRVHIVAAPNVNHSTPVAVDIVYVFEESLLAELSTYTARKWFEEKWQLQRLYPSGFTVFDYELVPTAHATLSPHKEKKKFPKAHEKALKVLAYANYLIESNKYTLDISPYKRPTINLGEEKMRLADRRQ